MAENTTRADRATGPWQDWGALGELFGGIPIGIIVAYRAGEAAYANACAQKLLRQTGIPEAPRASEPEKGRPDAWTALERAAVTALLERVSNGHAEFVDPGGRRLVLQVHRSDAEWHGKPAMLVAITDVTSSVSRSDARIRVLKMLRYSLSISELLRKTPNASRIFSEIPQIISGIAQESTIVAIRVDRTGIPTEWYSEGDPTLVGAFNELRDRGEIPACAAPSSDHLLTKVEPSLSQAWPGCPPELRKSRHTLTTLQLEHDGERFGVLILCTPSAPDETQEFRAILEELRTEISLALAALTLREHEEELRLQLYHAQRLESVGRIAGGVAHDFNNLMTVVRGFCDLILDGEKNPADVREYVSKIRAAAMSASELTGNLLSYSRRKLVTREVINLNEVIGETTSLLERTLGDDIKLSVSLGSGAHRILADPTQAQQIIMNLCVNARDAMPDGGTLEIRTENVHLDEDNAATHVGVTPGDYVLLSVTDTGCGMDEDTLARAFDPFFTTKPEGSGTGLGLSTVYGIVKQNGGNVWIYSEPGKGTSVKVYLPGTNEDVAGRADSRPTAGDSGTGTILLVEDQKMIREIAVTVLRDSGYTVLEAASPTDALGLLSGSEAQVDVLVTDYVMPEMTGTELARRARELLPDLRIVLTSGFSSQTLDDGSGPIVDSVFLTKPFGPADLKRAVREALAHPR